MGRGGGEARGWERAGLGHRGRCRAAGQRLPRIAASPAREPHWPALCCAHPCPAALPHQLPATHSPAACSLSALLSTRRPEIVIVQEGGSAASGALPWWWCSDRTYTRSLRRTEPAAAAVPGGPGCGIGRWEAAGRGLGVRRLAGRHHFPSVQLPRIPASPPADHRRLLQAAHPPSSPGAPLQDTALTPSKRGVHLLQLVPLAADQHVHPPLRILQLRVGKRSGRRGEGCVGVAAQSCCCCCCTQLVFLHYPAPHPCSSTTTCRAGQHTCTNSGESGMSRSPCSGRRRSAARRFLPPLVFLAGMASAARTTAVVAAGAAEPAPLSAGWEAGVPRPAAAAAAAGPPACWAAAARARCCWMN